MVTCVQLTIKFFEKIALLIPINEQAMFVSDFTSIHTLLIISSWQKHFQIKSHKSYNGINGFSLVSYICLSEVDIKNSCFRQETMQIIMVDMVKLQLQSSQDILGQDLSQSITQKLLNQFWALIYLLRRVALIYNILFEKARSMISERFLAFHQARNHQWDSYTVLSYLKSALQLSLQRFQHISYFTSIQEPPLKEQQPIQPIILNFPTSNQQLLEKGFSPQSLPVLENNPNLSLKVKKGIKVRGKKGTNGAFCKKQMPVSNWKRLPDLRTQRKIKKLNRSQLRYAWVKQRTLRHQATANKIKTKKPRRNREPSAKIEWGITADALKLKRQSLLQRKVQDWTTPNLICKISRQMAYLLS